MAIVNGLGYDDWAPKLLRASPAERTRGAERRASARPAGRRQPAPLVLPGRRARGDRADRRRLRPARPRATPPTSRSGSGRSKRTARALRRSCAGEIRAALRGRSPSATARASSRGSARISGLRLLTPAELRAGDRRGHRRDRAGQADRRSRRRASGQIRVWVFNSQNVTPDVQRVTELARAAPHPGGDRDRDALAGLRQLPAVAGRRARRPARERCIRRRVADGLAAEGERRAPYTHRPDGADRQVELGGGAERALSEAGYRRGGARRAIVELLDEQSCALSAAEIEHALTRAGREVSRASVYRVMDELEEIGAGAARGDRPGHGPLRARAARAGPPPPSRVRPLRAAASRSPTTGSSGRSARVSERLPLRVSEHEIVIHGACETCADS